LDAGRAFAIADDDGDSRWECASGDAIREGLEVRAAPLKSSYALLHKGKTLAQPRLGKTEEGGSKT